MRHIWNSVSIFDQKQPAQRCSVKRCVLKTFAKFTGKHLCQSLFLTKAETCNFIKKENPAQMLSCEYCEYSRTTFLQNTYLDDCFCLIRVARRPEYIINKVWVCAMCQNTGFLWPLFFPDKDKIFDPILIWKKTFYAE